MIEVVEEIKTEKEQPTETDIRLVFTDLKRAMDALQKLFVMQLKKLNADNINTEHASIEIKENEMIVRLGDYVLFYKVSEWVTKLGVLDG